MRISEDRIRRIIRQEARAIFEAGPPPERQRWRDWHRDNIPPGGVGQVNLGTDKNALKPREEGTIAQLFGSSPSEWRNGLAVALGRPQFRHQKQDSEGGYYDDQGGSLEVRKFVDRRPAKKAYGGERDMHGNWVPGGRDGEFEKHMPPPPDRLVIPNYGLVAELEKDLGLDLKELPADTDVVIKRDPNPSEGTPFFTDVLLFFNAKYEEVAARLGGLVMARITRDPSYSNEHLSDWEITTPAPERPLESAGFKLPLEPVTKREMHRHEVEWSAARGR